MNKLFSKKLWFVLTGILSTLLMIVIAVTCVAYEYAPLLNTTFKLKNYRVIEGDDDDEKISYTADYSTSEDIISFYSDVSENLEAEGLVLMKNDNDALPLEKNGLKVSLFGTGSVYVNSSAQGMRSAEDKVNFPTLKEAFEDLGVEVNPTLWNFYDSGAASSYGGTKRLDSTTNIQTYYINEVPWNVYNSTVQSSFKDYGDAAIVVFTRDSTEGTDVNVKGSDGADGSYLSLSAEESDLLVQLTQLKRSGTFDTIVVLLNSAQAIQMDFLYAADIDVDACLWIGNTGMSGVNAVAKALVGDVVPSGRLTDTYVKDNLSSPAMASWILNNENGTFARSYNDSRLDTTQQYYGVYVEGIYVGYRYYETRYADVVEDRKNVGDYDYDSVMAFTFGSGLSYTQFEYSNFTVEESADGKSFDVSVTVTNKGDVYSGKEVVQIYLQKPYTEYAQTYQIEVSAIELVGFTKTGILAPDASETVTVNVEKSLFTSYDVYGAGTYILDGGDYYLTVGKDAHDALNNVLAAKGYTAENSAMTADGDSSLVHKQSLSMDTETYSVSALTGNTIENQLGSVDPNRYVGGGSNHVTYVSRSNWTDTWPTQAVNLTLTEDMYNDLQNDFAVESVGEMPTLGENNGMTLSMLFGKDYDDPDWDKLLDQLTFDEMNTLITTCISQTPSMEGIVKPLTLDMDGPTYCKEGDNDCRLPCEGIWAATFNRELIADAGAAIANDALYAGFQGMYAPGVNIHRTPFGGRAHEYFSEDPVLSGMAAETEIQSMQSYGVIVYVKHYAFNDQECNRNGIGIWLNEQSAREIYLRPFEYACSSQRGNAHALMSSFNRAGCGWTSANKNLITNILKDEFGFEGFVLTDMADSNGTSYMSCIDGIMAGTDAWLSSGKNHTLVDYSGNAAVVTAMRESTHKILYNICNYSAAMSGYSASTRIERVLVWWEIVLISSLSVVGVLTVTSCGMYVFSKLKKK